MKDLICDEFQNVWVDLLIRHRSVLDILSKLSEANSRVTRAVTKAITTVAASLFKLKRPRSRSMLILLRNWASIWTITCAGVCPNCEEVVISENGQAVVLLGRLYATL
jgi:hypothetical protein